jgi:membrane carboxypeptidase/penicillin-binding protein PbpC
MLSEKNCFSDFARTETKGRATIPVAARQVSTAYFLPTILRVQDQTFYQHLSLLSQN